MFNIEVTICSISALYMVPYWCLQKKVRSLLFMWDQVYQKLKKFNNGTDNLDWMHEKERITEDSLEYKRLGDIYLKQYRTSMTIKLRYV